MAARLGSQPLYQQNYQLFLIQLLGIGKREIKHLLGSGARDSGFSPHSK